jgi:hypothetical protein
MKLSRTIRNFCFGVLLAFSTWSAQAAVSLLQETAAFPGTGFQFKFYDFLIDSSIAPLGGTVTATLTDTKVLDPFSFLALAIFKTGGAAVAPTLTVKPGAADSGSFSFFVAPGALGSYTALVMGTPVNPLISVYGIDVSIAPVIPEPEIWALMLVGTGLVGFQLSRKRKQAEANRLA